MWVEGPGRIAQVFPLPWLQPMRPAIAVLVGTADGLRVQGRAYGTTGRIAVPLAWPFTY